MHRKTKRTLVYAVLVVVALIQIAPLVATLFNSFRTDKAIKMFPIGLPTELNLANYVRAWTIGGYTRAFANSISVSVVVTTVIVLVAVVTGYFLVRSRARIKHYLFVYYGVALSIPVFSYLVPLYYTFARLDLVNSIFGLILIYTAIYLPFNVLLARSFIIGIPQTLDEAATIDGCTTYQVIGKIIFPLAKPIITTIALIVFVTTWKEFTIANTFLQSPELKTASTKYVLFVGERGADLSLVFTAAVITMLPIVAAFIALQNYFITGMTTGSIK